MADAACGCRPLCVDLDGIDCRERDCVCPVANASASSHYGPQLLVLSGPRALGSLVDSAVRLFLTRRVVAYFLQHGFPVDHGAYCSSLSWCSAASASPSAMCLIVHAGWRHFMTLYLSAGVVANAVHVLLYKKVPCLGASGWCVQCHVQPVHD